jgi:membrane protein
MNIKQDVLPLLKETAQEFQKDDAGQLGAALAYYAVFSLFPLLLLLLAVLGFVLSYWDKAINVEQAILGAVSQNFSPELSQTLGEVLGVVRKQAGAATGIGLVTLALGASGVFQQLDMSFNKIWNVPKPAGPSGIVASITTFLHDKLFSFGMLLGVGFLLLVSMALTGVTQALLGVLSGVPLIGGGIGFVLGLVVTLALNALIFALLFKYLPDVKVPWRDVWIGAVLTALIWELAKRLLALYIGHSTFASAYGAIGTLLVLMAWVYFSSQVLFLGAEFTEVYSRHNGSRASVPTAEPAAPAPAPAPQPQPAPAAASTSSVAAATGTGLLIGAVGGAIAGVAALVIGARRAVTRLPLRRKRTGQ